MWLALAAVLALQVDTSPIYSREITISPVRLTHKELAELFLRVNGLATKANDKLDPDRLTEIVTIKGTGGTGYTYRDRRGSYDFSKLPQFTNNFSYSYSHKSDAPVSRISLILTDTSRLLTVEGASPEQVDGILSVVSEFLGDRTTILGGWGFRLLAGLIAIVLSNVLVQIPKWRGAKGVVIVISTLVGVPILMFALPWEYWLPGTGIYSESASWIVRNSAEFSFCSGLASLLFPLAGVIRKRLIDENGTPKETTTKESSTQESQPSHEEMIEKAENAAQKLRLEHGLRGLRDLENDLREESLPIGIYGFSVLASTLSQSKVMKLRSFAFQVEIQKRKDGPYLVGFLSDEALRRLVTSRRKETVQFFAAPCPEAPTLVSIPFARIRTNEWRDFRNTKLHDLEVAPTRRIESSANDAPVG